MPRINAYQPAPQLAYQSAPAAYSGQAGQASPSANNVSGSYPSSYYYPPTDMPVDAGQGLNPGQVIQDTQKLLQGNPLKKAWNWLKQNWLTVILLVGGSYVGFQGVKAAGKQLNSVTKSMRGITPETELKEHGGVINSLIDKLQGKINSIQSLNSKLNTASSLSEKASLEMDLRSEEVQYEELIAGLRDVVAKHQVAKQDESKLQIREARSKSKDESSLIQLEAEHAALVEHHKQYNPQRLGNYNFIEYLAANFVYPPTAADNLIESVDRNGYPKLNGRVMSSDGTRFEPAHPNPFNQVLSTVGRGLTHIGQRLTPNGTVIASPA